MIGQLSSLGELNHSISIVSLSVPLLFSAGESGSGIACSERLEQRKENFKILNYVISAEYATEGIMSHVSMGLSPSESSV